MAPGTAGGHEVGVRSGAASRDRRPGRRRLRGRAQFSRSHRWSATSDPCQAARAASRSSPAHPPGPPHRNARCGSRPNVTSWATHTRMPPPSIWHLIAERVPMGLGIRDRRPFSVPVGSLDLTGIGTPDGVRFHRL